MRIWRLRPCVLIHCVQTKVQYLLLNIRKTGITKDLCGEHADPNIQRANKVPINKSMQQRILQKNLTAKKLLIYWIRRAFELLIGAMAPLN